MSYNQILLSVSALWVASELALSIGRRSKSNDSHLDRRSLQLLWAALTAACILGGMAQGLRSGRVPFSMNATLIAGVGLIVAGIAFRWIAILTLKSMFTVDVAIRKDHVLVDRGIYSILRHPSYTGALLSFIGLGVAYRNWYSLAIMAIGTFAALSYRIAVEERALRGAFGAAYDAYAKKTSRLVPGIY
jgi:protein-S-isoprenylcysteine O-methyltransferase Ste14